MAKAGHKSLDSTPSAFFVVVVCDASSALLLIAQKQDVWLFLSPPGRYILGTLFCFLVGVRKMAFSGEGSQKEWDPEASSSMVQVPEGLWQASLPWLSQALLPRSLDFGSILQRLWRLHVFPLASEAFQ